MNPNVARVPPSLIRAINARKRPGDIDMGLGEPSLRPDPEPFEAAVEWIRRHGCPYSPNAGVAELREAIARYLAVPRRTDGSSVCVTVGSEEALYLALKTVVDPARHEVLVVEPCYLAYPKICILEGIRYRTVAMLADRGFAPSADRVLEAVRPDTRVVVLNSPANPTGRVWPADELRRLASGLAESVLVLSDEVYRELHYTPEPPVSIATFHAQTLVAGSLSKSNALTGLRLGWLSGPPDIVASAVKVHQFVNTAADIFAQRVALELLRDPSGLGNQRDHYLALRESLVSEGKRHGLDFVPPEGTFYAMVRLPHGLETDSLAAAERLLERHRVAAVPGSAFGSSAEGWLRISWGIGEAPLKEGLRRLASFLGR
jgi:aspartate/methionine/tyrosine aminotransferase